MKIINASYEILTPINGAQILKNIELAGRTCYKSENKITDDSARSFVRGIIAKGHESVLEHQSLSVRFICDRGVSHEIVRHRLASYSQESTRYCNYANDSFDNELTFIKPCFWSNSNQDMLHWQAIMLGIEQMYMKFIRTGSTAQEARCLLPNSLKTEVIMTANLREWRHFLKLRTAPEAHPQMRELTVPLLAELKKRIPVIFDDIL